MAERFERHKQPWTSEEIAKLHTLATPEMVSYFTKDLEENKARNDINKVSDVKLLQGDLAEAWREGETDYASVAMRFSLIAMAAISVAVAGILGSSNTVREYVEAAEARSK